MNKKTTLPTVNMDIPAAFAELITTPARYKVYYGGRASGKSHAKARALLILAMQKKLRVMCCREIQKSIEHSVHKLLADIIRDARLDSFFTIQETAIKGANGSEFIFQGLKANVSAIKSTEGIDICWVEEAETVSEASWELLVPTIRKEGSEIWVTFNTRAVTDPTYQRFIVHTPDNAIIKKVSWRDNPFLPQSIIKEMESLKARDYEAYLHVYEGNPDNRKTGFILAKQLLAARESGRITTVPYDPETEVFTAWDLGYGDSTAIWFLQYVGRELRWLECYANNGEQLQHYAQVIKSKPYNYMARGHYLPHDAAAGHIVGMNASHQLRELGLPNTVLPRTDIAGGIEALRQVIGFSVFDKQKCAEGLDALENYSYAWNEDLQRFREKPLHDWCSHYADAARYAAQAAKTIKGAITRKTEEQAQSVIAYPYQRYSGRGSIGKPNGWLGG